MKKIDYPEFQKKPVVFRNRHGNDLDALVVDCNYHVGNTVVLASDTDVELFCLNRAEYFGFRNDQGKITHRLPNWKRAYSLMFYNLVAQIKTGHIKNTGDFELELMENICNYKIAAGRSHGSNCAWK